MEWKEMKTAILLHGRPGKDEYYDPEVPSASNFHWLPWLQKQLLVRGISAHTPEVPNAWRPDYSTWCKEFERYEITPDTMLVGHSCGGGFIVRWLSEHKDVNVDKVVLVAPWLDPDHEEPTDFFDFTIDPRLAARTARLTIFNSDNDDESIQQSVYLIRSIVSDVHYREFHEYGHFRPVDMDTSEFPALVEALV